MSVRRFRATVAYEGTAYCGFQRQRAGTPTVQGAIERAIAEVTGQQATVIGAGRTDTGVHATGQVIAFDVTWGHDDGALLKALNAALPADIALQDIRQQEGFHPRFDAVSRVYKYTLLVTAARQPLSRLRAWQLRGPLDGEALQAAASVLTGRRDFAALGQPPKGENTVRTVIASDWRRTPAAAGEEWVYTIEADAFLQHMVRRTVSLLIEAGRGRLTAAGLLEVLEAGKLARVPLAPPYGLVLERVKYADASRNDDRVSGSEE